MGIRNEWNYGRLLFNAKFEHPTGMEYNFNMIGSSGRGLSHAVRDEMRNKAFFECSGARPERERVAESQLSSKR